MNSFFRKIRLVSNFLESLIVYVLDIASKSVLRTIIVFILAPILIFAILYWLSAAVMLNDKGPLPAGWEGFLYSLYYSIATFTGTEPGDLAPHHAGLWLTSLEAILAVIFIAVAIGYIVNRLSSR